MFNTTKKALKRFIEKNINMQKLSLDDKNLEDQINKTTLTDLSTYITSEDRKYLPQYWLKLKPKHIDFI